MNRATKSLVMAVLNHNSSEKNTVCCIEEMSELIKVLTKKLRKSEKFSIEKLTEEISHVLLLCNVIAAEHGIREKDILKEQMDAVQRMEEEDGVRR